MMTCDICIIGGGIGGFISAYVLEKMYPDKTFYLIEKNNSFVESSVNMVSGVVQRDFKFLQFLNELDVSYQIYHGNVTYEGITFPYEERLVQLRQYASPHISFKDLYLRHFLPFDYDMFTTTVGEKELYENADSSYVLFEHPFDTFHSYDIFHFSLSDFFHAIISRLKRTRLYLNTQVIFIEKNVIQTIGSSSIQASDIVITSYSVASTLCKYLKKTVVPIDTYNIILYTLSDSLYQRKTYVKNMFEKIYNEGNGTYRIQVYNKDILLSSVNQIRELFKYPFYNIQCSHVLKNAFYYTPLSSNFSTRQEYIQHTTNPIQGIHIVSNFLSFHQNTLSGYLESLENINNIKK
jgi:hypothetical protein